jgi:MerR family transcriptional regulator/heat shock protein HspR
MPKNRLPDDEPCYVISVAAKLVSMHPQTLRYYDRVGLIRPTRTTGRIRLYSQADIDRLQKITRLTVDLGVNLAGVEVVLNMANRIEELQRELARVRTEAEAELAELRQRLSELEGKEVATRKELPVINVSARKLGPKENAS